MALELQHLSCLFMANGQWLLLPAIVLEGTIVSLACNSKVGANVLPSMQSEWKFVEAQIGSNFL